MKNHIAAGLGSLMALASPAAGQSMSIDHQPVACATADRFARLEARFSPAESVAMARVVFQGQTADWYSVAMKPEGSAFTGVLPKPKKDLKSFHYYIEVTDKALGTNRTSDYAVAVVDSSSACKGKAMAGALSSASVILQGPAGVAALPAGFASSGVVAGSAAGSTAGASSAAAAGGGGLSTAAVVGIAGGVAAAAGVAVAAKNGGSEDSGSSYTGPVSGQYTVTQVAVGNVTTTCAFLRSLSGSMTVLLGPVTGSDTGEANLDMTESGISVSGSSTCSGTGPSCCGPVGFTCSLSGSSGNFNCTSQRTSNSNGSANTQSFGFSGSLTGGVVNGVLTYQSTGQSTTNGSSATHSGSTSIPLTLR
jgi:hypothetical protein